MLASIKRSMGLLAFLGVPFVVALGWISLSCLVGVLCKYPKGKRICLLIAHCDDEAMFFSPTVIRLADPGLNNNFQILCLSNGEDPSLRHTRTEELFRSASNLGLRSASDVACLDDDVSFPDSMTTYWSPEKVAQALSDRFPEAGSSALDMLITFDQYGISSHANHISLLQGASHWLRHLSSDRRKATALYSLTTTNIFRKYMTILDAPFTTILYFMRRSRPGSTVQSGISDSLIFFSGFSSYRKAQRSMTACHKSQMLWFRYGWIFLSRYMSINDLIRRDV